MLIATISGTTDINGLVGIRVNNSFSNVPYVLTNIRNDLNRPYIVVVNSFSSEFIMFRIRNSVNNKAIINTELPSFDCIIIGK